MNEIRKRVVVGVAVTALLTVLAACEPKEGPAERAGKALDKSVEKAGQQIEKAGQKIQDTAQDAKK